MGYRCKLLIISLLFCSCAKRIAFTSEVQNEYGFSEQTLKKVQFYTSDIIVLSLTKSKDDASVNEGKLLMREAKKSETIIIKKNTPCILEEIIDNNKFLFSFESGNDRVLLFGNNSTGYYSLMAKEWENQKAIIKYAGKEYTTSNGNVFLTVKIKKLRHIENKQRTVKGRKI